MAVTVTIYLLKDFNYKNAFIIGACFGLANNVRSELLLFPVILAVLIRKKAIISLFAGFILFMSIHHIVNYINYGEYHLIPIDGLKATFAGGHDENTILNEMGFNLFKSGAWSTFLNNPIIVSRLIVKGC